MKRAAFFGALAVALPVIFLLVSCISTKLEKRLDSASEEFYSKVRYIISKDEAKIFFELPPSARSKFIDDFWKRRDPTPETERNEYREAYFDRIEEANRLFRGGRPGWLQDRGRIYILFGPPDERLTNPMGGRIVDPYESPDKMVEGRDTRRIATGEKPTEVWVYYKLFSSFQLPQVIRLVFVDTTGTGDYTLTTNLDELLPGTMGVETGFAPNLIFVHEFSKEESERAKGPLIKPFFDFSWEFVRGKKREFGGIHTISIVLPYKKIIFRKDGERLKADMELQVEVKSVSGETIWQSDDIHPISFSEDFLNQNRDKDWKLEVPIEAALKKGKYTVYLRLRNLSGDQEVEKLLPLKI